MENIHTHVQWDAGAKASFEDAEPDASDNESCEIESRGLDVRKQIHH